MRALNDAIETLLGPEFRVLDAQAVSGGCISDAKRVSVVRGSKQFKLFVKANELAFLDNFQCERDGLSAIAKTQTIKVPEPLAVGQTHRASWLITQWIEPSTQSTEFYMNFGKQLAELHLASKDQAIGWHRDNYLGAAFQVNTARGSWADFFAENRIGYQLRWAIDQGYCDTTLHRDGQAIVRAMDSLMDGREKCTSLLHGDLWSGNYLCDHKGTPVVVDPAVYRGCREAEFGMLKLFGSCPVEFYDSYQQTWPLKEGWQRRVKIYIWYHVLNHLNLFGSGYLEQCKSLASQILRA